MIPRLVIIVPAALLSLVQGGAAAEEIAPFRMTGLDGYASLQYVNDEQRSDQVGAPRSRQAQSGWRNEIFAMVHSYIYHPNLMTLDIGGGPILHNESFAGDTGSARARGLLYNFSARANFLRDKPYTGTLYFSHLNPTVSVAPGQVLTQENVRYGFDLSILAPASPLPLQIGFVRAATQGRGGDRQVNDHSDQFHLTATRSFDALGYTQVQYQQGSQASQSGNLDLPVQSSTASNQAVTVDTRLQFGDRRQYDLTNVVSLNEQKYVLDTGAVPPLRDLRVIVDGRARHSDQFHSHGLFSYVHSSQGALDTATQSASAGVSYWPTKATEAGMGVRGEEIRTQQFQAHSQGVDGSLRHELALPVGTLQASYGARYDRRQQVTAAPNVPVVGEQLSLASNSQVALSHPHVVSGTPVVSNASRSQIYVADVDYTLTVVGTETRLQRLLGGHIVEGEQVLVDYSYDTGGTYGYSQFDQTLSFNWAVSRYLNIYSRHFSSHPQLLTGVSSFALNEVASDMLGGHAEFPYNPGLALTLGGNIEREVRRETISPYRRTSSDIYVQTEESAFGLGFLRASLRRARIAYQNALQDSDLRSYEIRYWSREWFGIDLTAAFNAEREDAGLLPRQRQTGSIGASWQERKLSMSASYVRTRESQGGMDRDRSFFQFLLRREL